MTFEQFNPFFQYCSKGVLFLFTTLSGWIIIASVLFFSLLLSIIFEIKEQKRLAKASNLNLSKSEIFFRTLKILGDKIGQWATNLPTLVIVILIAVSISSLTVSFSKINNYLDNQQRIKELNTVVKHLDKKYKIAQVTALDLLENNFTKIRLDFFDQNETKIESRILEIHGRDIFVDALVCNFAFSEIENGSKVNLSVPYRIFTDLIPQVKGQNLFPCDTKGIPYIFSRNEEEIYGIDKKAFDNTVYELSRTIYDAKQSQEKGIVRSIYGNAVHKKLSKAGDTFVIWTEQTGGLSITNDPLKF